MGETVVAFTIYDPEPQQGGYTIMDAPKKIGMAAQGDFLRDELKNADWFSRNLAGFGTAGSNLWEGAKQFVGQGDQQAIEANKIIEQEAPVGAIAGNVAMTAIPFGMAGNTIGAAAKVGTVLGALNPVEGEQTAENIVRGKIKGAAVGGATGALGQAIANKSGEYVASKLQDLAVKKAQNAGTDKALADALDAGLVVPPSSVNPTFANVAKESIAGKIGTAQTASNKNTPVVENMLRRSIGLAPDAPLTVEATQAVRAKAYADGYKPIADLPAISEDPAFLASVVKLSPRSSGGAVKSAAQAEIDDMIGALANQKQWSGAQLIGDIQALREQATANFRGTAAEQALARAQREAAKLLEGLAERNIIQQGGSPGQVQAMRDARTLIAKAHTVEESILRGGGSPDTRVFAARSKAGKPLSDEQKTIGDFAAAYPKAMQPEAQVAGPGISALKPMLSLIGGAGGAVVGGPAGAAVMAAAPFVVPPAVRAYLLSRHSQNALRDLYRLGLPTRAANSLLQYAPVGGTVLGRKALSE